ncbi:zinc finger, CCHC-type containing protein [Tanacetum coccineum]
MSVVYMLTTPMPENRGENPTVEQVRKRAKWDNDDYVCRGLILNGMSDSLFDIYQSVETSKELWDTLETKYMAEDASSKKFLEELTLVELGSHLRIEKSLKAQDNDKPKGNNVAGPSVVNMVEHNNSSRHLKKDCKPSNIGNKANGSGTKGLVDGSSNPLKCQKMFNKSLQVYYVTYVSEAYFMQDDNVMWWVDSRATVHVCKDRCWFKTYDSLNDGSILHMGNESTAMVHGRGCVDLTFSSGKIVSLLNILHVPNIRKNLVSSSVLNNCCYKQVIKSNKFVLSKHGVFIGFGYLSNYMFRLNIVNDNIGLAFMSTSKLNDSILWHVRLGHVHFKRMQDMSKDGLIPAFDMDTEKCKTCMLTKINKKPFQNVKRKTEVLELIYSDLCDLHATPSLGNKKYFVTFIDDSFRFCYVYLLHTKGEALDKFKVFKTEVKLQQGSLIKRFRTDRGVVRLSNPKLKTLVERGIECIFVGYAEHSKDFRFYVIEPNDLVAINSIIESRDSIFDENRFSLVPRPSQRSLVKEIEDSSGSVVPKKVIEEDVAFWKEAINDEMDSIMVKIDGTVEKVKARLVIQGFKPKSGIDYFDTYDLVARISTIRLLITMASIPNLIIHQMDVKTAFLNGELEDEIESHKSSTEHPIVNEFIIINIPEEDVEPEPNLPLQEIIILDPDDQPMWESAKTVAPTPNYAIFQIDVDDKFVINSTHLKMISKNKFDGIQRADPHDHIREFLAICDMFKYGETQSEAVKLLIFPYSLSDKAKTWFNELNEESITSWEQMRKYFINKFFPPLLFNRLLLEIKNFSQLVCESPTEAWLRLKSMLRKCHGHGLTKGVIIQIFYRGLNEPTQAILDVTTGGIFLYKSPNQAFQLLEDKVLFNHDWSIKSKNEHYQKYVAFADGKLNNDVKNDLEDFKRCIRSMRTVYDKLFDQDNGKTTGVLPNKKSKPINQERQSKTDFEKLMTKFLDDQRVTTWKTHINSTLVSTPMDTSEKLMPNNGQAVPQLEYYRVISCLMYAMTCTRPDIAFDVGKLSRYTSSPGYTDASWISNTEDNSSTSGWVVLLATGKEAEWMKILLIKIPLWSKPISPIYIRCDSAATLAKAYSQMYNGKSRHLSVRHSMIHELIMNGVVTEHPDSDSGKREFMSLMMFSELLFSEAECNSGLNGIHQSDGFSVSRRIPSVSNPLEDVSSAG